MTAMDRVGLTRALDRFRVVSHVEAYVVGGQSLADAVTAVCRLESGRFGRSSVYEWYRAFKGGGADALFDKPRPRRGCSLPLPFLDFLRSEKRQDPDASIPEVIARARERGLVPSSLVIDRTTVFRAARAFDLPMLRRKKAESTTMRPFAYERRMMMVLCDGKHFRAGDGRLKRVALFFIDDATRYVLDVFVGYSESQEFFLKSLFSVVQTFGSMDALYLDNGSGFNAGDTKRVMANLGIPLIFGTAGYAEGHGKIERFNGTVTQAALRGLQKPTIDPACSALEIRLRHYIHERYNQQPQGGVGGVPAKLFEQDAKPLCFANSEEVLRRSFILTETRKVRRDNVIHWDGGVYETPRGYAGRTITIYRDVVSRQVWQLHNGVVTPLQPPDLGLNAREPRAQGSRQSDEPSTGPITTAAEIHFNRDFSPIVQSDGGYCDKPPSTEEQNE